MSFTDSIEANVEYAEIQVAEGLQQLSKARSYQVYATVNSDIYVSVLFLRNFGYPKSEVSQK